MLFKSVHSSHLLASIISILLLLALWMRLYIVDMAHITTFDNPSMPLWNAIIVPLFGYSKYTAAVLSTVLAFLTAFALNRVVLKFGLIQQQSMLSFFVYTLLSGAFLSVQQLNPVWFFALFFILGIEQLFAAVNVRKPQVKCFNASLLVGIGSLFYAKGVFLFLFFFMVMVILRVAGYKTIIASLMGFIFPFAASFTYYFYSDNAITFLSEINENLFSNPGQYNHNVFSRIYVGILIIFNMISLVLSFGYMSSQKILTRRYFRCFTWMLFIICGFVLTPFFSMELIPVLSLVTTVIIVLWLHKMRNRRIPDIVLLLLIALTISGQFFLY